MTLDETVIPIFVPRSQALGCTREYLHISNCCADWLEQHNRVPRECVVVAFLPKGKVSVFKALDIIGLMITKNNC